MNLLIGLFSALKNKHVLAGARLKAEHQAMNGTSCNLIYRTYNTSRGYDHGE
jgi:hypothetical protein